MFLQPVGLIKPQNLFTTKGHIFIIDNQSKENLNKIE